jgi:hypothetical protein
MSSAHYTLVNGATSSPTADTIAKRGSSGEIAGVWFAPALSGVATSGLVRSSSSAQTLIATRNAANSANVAVVAMDGADGIAIGDANTASLSLAGGGGGATLSGFSFAVDKPVTATYFADTLSHVATTGVFRSTGDAQVVVAARNAADSANLALVEIDGSDGVLFGASSAPSATIRASDAVDLLGALAGHGSGVGVVGVKTATTEPTAAPSGGALVYVDSAGTVATMTAGKSVTTLAPAVTDSDAIGPLTRNDVLRARIIRRTTDGSTITAWSITPNAQESVFLRVLVEARYSDLHIKQERHIYINTAAGAPALTTDTIGTDLNTILGTSAVAYDYSGGAVRVRATGNNPNSITWFVEVECVIRKP